jgi:hypothetical protein
MQDVGENDQEERKAESEKPSRKKAKMGDSPSLAPSTRSPQMIVSIPGDMSDDDDFFTSMDPNAADLKPVSGRVAASTFFKALDEHKEAARSARDASSSGAAAAAFVDDKFASLSFADPPLDWNIHGKIRFTSTESFAWIEEHDGEVSEGKTR